MTLHARSWPRWTAILPILVLGSVYGCEYDVILVGGLESDSSSTGDSTSDATISRQWAIALGSSDWDMANAIAGGNDNQIVASFSDHLSSDSALWLTSLSGNGDVLWQAMYSLGAPNSIQRLPSGDFIISGQLNSPFESNTYIVQITTSGHVVWAKMLQGCADRAWAIQSNDDHVEYALLSGPCVLFLDEAGSLLDSYRFTERDVDFFGHSIVGTRIARDPSGGVLLVGSIIGATTDDDILVVSLDRMGGSRWQKAYRGDSRDVAESIMATSDGGFLIVGYTNSAGSGSEDVLIIKLDAMGNPSWIRTVGGAGFDLAVTGVETSDAEYAIAGVTSSGASGESDILVLGLNTEGELLWQKRFGGTQEEGARALHESGDGDLIIAGYTSSYGSGSYDAWIIKVDARGGLSSACPSHLQGNLDLDALPLPLAVEEIVLSISSEAADIESIDAAYVSSTFDRVVQCGI